MATIIPTIHAGHPTGLVFDLPHEWDDGGPARRAPVEGAVALTGWLRGGLHTERDKPASAGHRGTEGAGQWVRRWQVSTSRLDGQPRPALKCLGAAPADWRLSPDREALFAAAMLHDAGLTPVASHTAAKPLLPHPGCPACAACLEGATDLRTLEVVVQAIARHLDLHVDVGDGVEAPDAGRCDGRRARPPCRSCSPRRA